MIDNLDQFLEGVLPNRATLEERYADSEPVRQRDNTTVFSTSIRESTTDTFRATIDRINRVLSYSGPE